MGAVGGADGAASCVCRTHMQCPRENPAHPKCAVSGGSRSSPAKEFKGRLEWTSWAPTQSWRVRDDSWGLVGGDAAAPRADPALGSRGPAPPFPHLESSVIMAAS